MGRTMFFCPNCGQQVTATGVCPRCGTGGVPEGGLVTDEPRGRTFLTAIRQKVAALLGRKGA